jgi:beta-lactamase superfamily II metal-dependent hydrolase
MPDRKTSFPSNDAPDVIKIHLLDVGPEEYGDAVLLQLGTKSVLIDGAHPGNWQNKGVKHPAIQTQVGNLLEQSQTPFEVDLLIVTHCHADHIGCLPALIDKKLIRAEWALVADPGLGWGHSDSDTVDRFAGEPPNVLRLAAMLREEPLAPDTTMDLDQFAADAVTLETRYKKMLDQLAAAGTRVVRYGKDKTAPLLSAFQDIGLEIVGPSPVQLAVCAKLIEGRSQDLMDRASEVLPAPESADAATLRSAYFRVVSQVADARGSADAASKDKGAINDQSLVTLFNYKGVMMLFAGDMQFEEPEVSDERVNQELEKLLQTLEKRKPYDLVKLSHHGSYNGFSETIWKRLGKPTLMGICAGEDSKSHPNPKVLEMLKAHRDAVQWARTDHNGQTTFVFTGDKPEINVSRGKLNDPVPNSADVAAIRPEGAVSVSRVSTGDVVEVTARIPHQRTRVTLTIDVQPFAESKVMSEPGPALQQVQQAPPAHSASVSDVNLAAGRNLPALLFVTSRDALEANIGREETAAVLASVRGSGPHRLLDSLAAGLTGKEATSAVQQELRAHRELQGVVLLGGYDVVPSNRVDVLPPDLRKTAGDSGDPDAFVVWSDDPYADIEGDSLPELPVTRIPDGKSSALVIAALEAKPTAGEAERRGLRNIKRPFADGIFQNLPGTSAMRTSSPERDDTLPSDALASGLVYIMLHGSDADSTRYWGEEGGRYPVAVRIENIPDVPGAVVFAGCCWGALPVETTARAIQPGQNPGARTADNSIALRFLSHGAWAFVGCTGTHYSPPSPPYDYFGGPMHKKFWQAIQDGAPPASALFVAKQAYAFGMKARSLSNPDGAPIEYKTLRQFTCLGLAW